MLLHDSVFVAKSNFLLNMNYCSGHREIYTGMSGHQSNTKFLTDVGIQGVPGGKVNILGGHSIGHSKQKTLYEHVSYSEWFPRYSHLTV